MTISAGCVVAASSSERPDAERALGQQVPRAPQPRLGECQRPHVHPWSRRDEGHEHREDDEGHLDEQARREVPQRDPAGEHHTEQQQGVHPEGPDRLAWGRDDGDDEEQRGKDLQVRGHGLQP
ncbi:hypothetical protein LP422_23670 [Janibacter limosus]|uniref:hypothetical protein n=1 Tax=Janibacter limosus TaxID=53458 RepID=UPI0035E1B522|nr:hypothetical protein LP422_23670 [Janibacter limosus]